MLLNDSGLKGYRQERVLWERPAVSGLVPGSREAFLVHFELSFEGSELLRQRTEGDKSVLGHWFSSRGDFTPRGIWRCLETFLVVTDGGWGGVGAGI